MNRNPKILKSAMLPCMSRGVMECGCGGRGGVDTGLRANEVVISPSAPQNAIIIVRTHRYF
jgi:hypothetical protein